MVSWWRWYAFDMYIVTLFLYLSTVFILISNKTSSSHEWYVLVSLDPCLPDSWSFCWASLVVVVSVFILLCLWCYILLLLQVLVEMGQLSLNVAWVLAFFVTDRTLLFLVQCLFQFRYQFRNWVCSSGHSSPLVVMFGLIRFCEIRLKLGFAVENVLM